MKFNFPQKFTYRNGFILAAVLIGFMMTFLSFDYGITEDTRFHNDHGKRILNYFKGIDDSAALSPINDEGKYINISDSELHLIRGMNGFGGFFDLVSNFLHQYFSFFGVYEFNNMINSIFGFLLFLFCGLLGKELGGWKVGLLTLVFMVLTPVLFGHSMNNPKDIPAAAFYMFSIFHIVKLLKELPVVTLKRAFFLILNISLLINIRVAGLMVIGYVLLAVFIWWFIENYKSNFKKIEIKDSLLLAGKTIAICIFSYLATSIFWPYAQTNPIMVPLEILFKAKEFNGFISTQLFEGEWRSSFEMPWYYAFKSLLILQMPLHIITGMILIPLLYFKQTKNEKVYYSIILFTAIFPLLLIVIGNVNSYSNSRQFLFVVPPIIVLSVLAYFKLFKLITQTKIRWAVFIVLGMLLLQPLQFMIINHPLQSSYYSPVIGGVKGAYGNYEIDYWGFGIKPAINWLKDNVSSEFDNNSPAKVRMYYGEQSKASYYLGKIPNLKYVLERRNSPNWDYSIIMLTEAKYKKDINVNWSPENTVHKIKVDGIPICYIVKNNIQTDKHVLELEQKIAKTPSVNGYVELSLLYYKKKDYFKSIEASRKVVSLDPNNNIAYNNLCSAYNELLMYDKAKTACEKSLLIKPQMQLAQNNLKASLSGIDRRKNRKLTPKEYLNLSYNYYKLMEYNKCIKVSMELLELEPNSVVAYNNICSSYAALKKYNEAIKACEKALEIDPDYQLAINNLKWAKKELVK
ncbi:tetratricopeptide repeat protein [Aquimarina sp. Aq78]|uniref:tetratricopeptide repeat protein n=1 Tax=Aquimarina sp. Aq78 TaxID=1191889 RepID=UPI000D10E036|nr:tetratricopeptide repeat protein [Aquimarina sp. Aq78]